MQSHAFPPLVEAFLVVEQPRQRLSHWIQALAPLDHERAPPLASVNGYYDPTLDQALLGVSYDELALGRERLAYVIEVAVLAEIGMIQPLELTEGDRRRFLGERLARCTVRVSHQRSVTGALSELVRRVRDRSQASAPLTPPRGSVDRLESARMHALSRPPVAGGPPPIPAPARRLSRHVIPRAPSPAPSPPPVPDAARERVSTAQMDPLDAQKLAAADLPPVVPVLSEPTRAHAAVSLPAGSIYARYLRSGRWVPLRVGALSLRGAALMAGALPRVGDQVHIAFGYADFRALVRGKVQKVSTPEEAARRGAASFCVAFELDDGPRRQLTALLHAARAANVTIKPPPARGDRRFPVQWPVSLDAPQGAIRAEALDVSREGLFVRQTEPLTLDTRLPFSIVLDDGGGPVAGRSRVARFLDEISARSCGSAPGYGLQIVEMAEADRERWLAFIGRIERRAQLRVLIGATRTRLRELQGRLAAAGYAVAAATDPDALVQLASGDERAVDACLIDAGWMPPGRATTWSETLFPTRTVPCVAMRGDVRRAREAIDQVLSVV